MPIPVSQVYIYFSIISLILINWWPTLFDFPLPTNHSKPFYFPTYPIFFIILTFLFSLPDKRIFCFHHHLQPPASSSSPYSLTIQNSIATLPQLTHPYFFAQPTNIQTGANFITLLHHTRTSSSPYQNIATHPNSLPFLSSRPTPSHIPTISELQEVRTAIIIHPLFASHIRCANRTPHKHRDPSPLANFTPPPSPSKFAPLELIFIATQHPLELPAFASHQPTSHHTRTQPSRTHPSSHLNIRIHQNIHL